MKEKANKRTSWYNKNKNKNKYKSTFFVDATPGSNLAKQCQKILHQCHIPIKVMERSGTSIKEILVKSNPFKEKKCNDATCTVCLSNSNISCKTRKLFMKMFAKTMKLVTADIMEKLQMI